jgi:hypothetical protein
MTIPRPIEASVLFDNDHTCCICNEKGKDVQIHHIDGNNHNNDPSNLAVLCLECHSKATARRGFGRKYSPLEVEKYKRNWEFAVKERRKLLRQHVPRRTKNWVEIETARIVYELAATKNMERAKEILGLLDLYDIFERNSSFALDQLHDVVPFISGPGKRALVAEHVLHYFWHLPGPEYVKIKDKDTKDLKRAIRFLEWMGTFEATTTRAPGPIRVSLDSLAEIFKTANLYAKRELQDAVMKAIKAIRKDASVNLEQSEVEIIGLIEKADALVARLEGASDATQRGR